LHYFGVAKHSVFAWVICDIAGMVAAMTEDDPDAESEKAPTTSLVNRDSATRRARRLAVEFEVGELRFHRLRS